ncbi:MAG: cytochrome C biogenesis protein [Nocardioides sp.]|nr:cytochrome C biogenesis protein [Nocardioides sp.]
MTAQLVLAYGLGMLALVNPCGFMMLPAFLAYNLSDTSRGAGRSGARLGRGLGAGLLVSLGFVATFTAAGLLVALGLRSITDAVPWFSVLIGAGLVILGLALAAGVRVGVNLGSRIVQRARPGGHRMVGFGSAYALAQLGCGMGSLLALVGTGVAAQSPVGTMTIFVAFGLGSTTMLVMLAVSTALASDVLVRTVRGALPAVARVSGLVLVATGVYLIVYWAPALSGGASSDTWASRLVHDVSASTRDLIRDNELTLTLLAVVLVGVSLTVVRRRHTDVDASTRESPDSRTRVR